MTDKPAAVQVAKEHESDEAQGKARVVKRYGVRARLVPVPEGRKGSTRALLKP